MERKEKEGRGEWGDNTAVTVQHLQQRAHLLRPITAVNMLPLLMLSALLQLILPRFLISCFCCSCNGVVAFAISVGYVVTFILLSFSVCLFVSLYIFIFTLCLTRFFVSIFLFVSLCENVSLSLFLTSYSLPLSLSPFSRQIISFSLSLFLSRSSSLSLSPSQPCGKPILFNIIFTELSVAAIK